MIVGLAILSVAWPAALVGLVLAAILRGLGVSPLGLLFPALSGLLIATVWGFELTLDTYWQTAPAGRPSERGRSSGRFASSPTSCL